ncbi:ligase-associated DNA damage response endonuclease PdeM [Pedobacter sp. MC2016-14]|uniref:ligase-associated DNA damage response endonuclease PdeM n=1 Tax=Pedobacter sp. MC2016-14 TaxID=2897327 RepID=UPI001E3D4063|nr:ligase-associated DNA damage response endonuclease PdeM [Pedobacter sp. MC2016-14]MCD0489020.1 ligase-associated DNA damage response endonuclease PdeM [Pedobacter sp. MC2016-14]
MTINCNGETLILDKYRAIYWFAKKMLMVSDLHIGKSAHFRKAGIPVPSTVAASDLVKLSSLIAKYDVETLLVTGDMFHNTANGDVAAFYNWRTALPDLKIWLVKGNHDDLRPKDYAQLDIQVFDKELLYRPFRFIHDKPDTVDEYYNISGHIHPGVTLHGKARQKLKFPCFYFNPTCAILPAFSNFTGLSVIKPKEDDRIFAITPSTVIEV